MKIESISDLKKREQTIVKIAERLGDEDYWTDFVENKGF